MTIELDPGEVSRVEPAIDEAASQSIAPDLDDAPVAQDLADEVSQAAPSEGDERAVEIADAPAATEEQAAGAEPPQAEPAGYGFDADDREAAREAAEPGPRQEPASPPPAAPVKRRRASTILAGAVGGVIALAGAGALQFAGVIGSPGAGSGGADAAVAAMRAEIDSLKQQMAGLGTGDDATGKLEALAGSLDKVTADLAALKSAVEQGGAGDGAAVSALDARIKEIEAAVAGLSGAGGAPSDTAIAAINEKIAAVEGQIKAAADAAAASDARFAALEQSIASLTAKVEAQAAQPKVALAIATAALKQALERGGPFAAELETFAAIAPDAPEIASLRAHAEKGVSTRADLQKDMPDAAKIMIAAAEPVEENAGFFQRLLNSAESLVTVRPIGEVEGPGVPETVARMEVALNAGDLGKAVAEYETLPEPVKAAGKDFADRIKARLEVEKLVDQAIAGAMKA